MSLFDICICKTVNLLKMNYWPIGCYDFEEHNPFTALMSNINERLISEVVDSSYSGTLSVTDLYPMLISGRVTIFKLDNVYINHEVLVSVLTALSIHGLALKTIVLNQLRYVPCRYFHEEQMSNAVALAVESLLALSPNLKSLRISVPFDLKTIQKIPALKRLDINFVPKNALYDMLPKIDNFVIPNDTLAHFSILQTLQYTIPPEEIAFILQYCTELKCLETDVSGGLFLLHSHELYEGTLSKQYKLEKITLGDMCNVCKDSAVATVSILHIVSVTCPNLKQLDVLLNDTNAIVALRDLKTLEYLLVQWEEIAYPEDFRLGIKLVLEEIGTTLTNLTIIYFSNIDFGNIGRSCPNLKSLRVEYETELPSEDVPRFESLEYLHLECNNGGSITKPSLLQLLSSSENISYLYLEKASSLDDGVLNQLLKVNKLSKLSEVHIIECNLSEVGVQSLVSCCPALDLLQISSADPNLEITVDMIHSINPMVIVMF